VAASITFSACGVVGPDETPWRSPASFAWPVSLEKRTIRYVHEDLDLNSTDTLTYVMDAEKDQTELFNGQPMYRLDRVNKTNDIHFLPLQDTLVVSGDGASPVALVAPIEKGHSWISAYKADSIPLWRATIVERYSYRNVQGTIYQNVIEVKYEPLTQSDIASGISWVRFFAEGKGIVQTIKVLNSPSTDSSLPDKSEPVERTVLIPDAASGN
jgi:hypothetical protein